MDTDVIKSLAVSNTGAPWCRVAAKATVDTDGLDYSEDGSPFWALSPTGETVTVHNAIFFGMNF